MVWKLEEIYKLKTLLTHLGNMERRTIIEHPRKKRLAEMLRRDIIELKGML